MSDDVIKYILHEDGRYKSYLMNIGQTMSEITKQNPFNQFQNTFEQNLTSTCFLYLRMTHLRTKNKYKIVSEVFLTSRPSHSWWPCTSRKNKNITKAVERNLEDHQLIIDDIVDITEVFRAADKLYFEGNDEWNLLHQILCLAWSGERKCSHDWVRRANWKNSWILIQVFFQYRNCWWN